MAHDPLSHTAEWLRPSANAAAPQMSVDDDKLLALFRDWVVAERAYAAINDTVSSKMTPAAEEKAAVEVAQRAAWEIRDRIALTPAAGPVGLAIKVYLFIELNDDGPRDDYAALSANGSGLYLDGGLEREIVRDLARFVPELAPLTASAIGGVRSAA
jgi:hypothetical protein